MKIIYTNISPVTISYTNINHFFQLKKQKPGKIYVCVWDRYVFEHPIFEKSLGKTKTKLEKIQENIQTLEEIMSFLKIDYKIILLSEAMNRLFRDPNLLEKFQQILSEIKIKELESGFALEYVPFKQISLSQINYIIADYLIASYLPQLYPELCSNTTSHYFTSERLKAFWNNITKNLSPDFPNNSLPKPIYAKTPVIMHPDEDLIPCIDMPFETIKEVIKAHYTKTPKEKELHDLIDIFGKVLDKVTIKDKSFEIKDVDQIVKNLKSKDHLDFISINLYEYLKKVKKIISKTQIQKQKKSFFVSNYGEFNSIVKPLNKIKFEILKNCNGNNTSLDISKKTGLKLSTVSTYLSHLRKNKLLDDSKRPKRLVESFVMDFGSIENT